jgi:hypothetical protein
MMVGRQLDERREGVVTDRFGASASRRERAARSEMRDVRWKPWNLIELLARLD